MPPLARHGRTAQRPQVNVCVCVGRVLSEMRALELGRRIAALDRRDAHGIVPRRGRGWDKSSLHAVLRSRIVSEATSAG